MRKSISKEQIVYSSHKKDYISSKENVPVYLIDGSMKRTGFKNRIGHSESRYVVPWQSAVPPKKILVIRLQALGDVVITLPYVQALRNNLPETEFHFLTREEFADIPENAAMFRRVFTLGGKRNTTLQSVHGMMMIPQLRKERYDIVIDLQRNFLSRGIRRALHPASFSEFDRFSLHSAGMRTAATIDALGFPQLRENYNRIELIDDRRGLDLLLSEGYDPGRKLIVINPAGNVITKNWNLRNYVSFVTGWMDHVDRTAQFLILGTSTIENTARYLKDQLGKKLISLAGKTAQSEALNILQKAELVLTEDSGLMHMAWVSQIPVVALFGSTRSVWSKPQGHWSVCLDSTDLECGECSEHACRFGDVHCLSRYSPEYVIGVGKDLLEKRRLST